MCLLQSQEITNRISNDISGRHFLGERAEQILRKGSQASKHTHSTSGNRESEPETACLTGVSKRNIIHV